MKPDGTVPESPHRIAERKGLPEPTDEKRTVLLVVEYDGSGFVGYQRQREGLSVQSALEEAGEQLTGLRPTLTASGRTDSGVHARALLVRAGFRRLNVPIERLPAALSAHLPAGAAVVAAYDVAPSFHPRRQVVRKLYRYRIFDRGIRSPLQRAQAWHVPFRLDLHAMRPAGRRLVGRHDFAAFAAEVSNGANTVRRIYALRIRRAEDVIELDVEGGGFLYNMVRVIAGSLVEVGRGRFPPEWIEDVLGSRDRTRAGPTAPPQGLVLTRAVPGAAVGRVRPRGGNTDVETGDVSETRGEPQWGC